MQKAIERETLKERQKLRVTDSVRQRVIPTDLCWVRHWQRDSVMVKR